MHNEIIKQQPVNFLDLERAYSDFATNFISRSVRKKQPFFLYYPSHVSNQSRPYVPWSNFTFNAKNKTEMVNESEKIYGI